MSAAGKPDSLHPHRLWSLWDMLEIKAEDFYRATTRIADMAAWLYAYKHDENSVFHAERELEDQDARFVKKHLTDLAPHLSTLGARVTAMAVAEAERYLQDEGATWGGAELRLDEIQRTFRRELRLTKILALEPKEQDYFEPISPLFGADFVAKFQTAGAFELDEAAKCRALGRPTACVFHLMRLMEIGLRASAQCLGITDPVKGSGRNWGTILESLKTEIGLRSARGATKAWPNPTDKEFFESVYASIDAVRVAWRNTTMHIENKYTDDEAEHIFVLVRGVMKNLASRCDENGEPKA